MKVLERSCSSAELGHSAEGIPDAFRLTLRFVRLMGYAELRIVEAEFVM